MNAADKDARPGPLTFWQYLRNAVFYAYIIIATIVIGLLGVPWLAGGRKGANRVASVWIRHVLWAARVIMGVRCEVRGVLPAGDCIIASKHQSALDIMALAGALPRRSFIMKRDVMRVPVMGWYAYKVGCIPIDRSRGGEAMRAIITAIQQRISGDGLGQLIIYPEGTRTRPGERRAYKHGVGTIRQATGLPVVPVAVNTGLFWPRGGWGIRSGRAVIEFMPVIAAEGTQEFMSRLEERVETQSDKLMAEAGFQPALADLPGR